MSTAAAVRRETRALVVEYAGALVAGRVIAVSVRTAALMAGSTDPDAVFMQLWEARVRRQLVDELGAALARTALERRPPDGDRLG